MGIFVSVWCSCSPCIRGSLLLPAVKQACSTLQHRACVLLLSFFCYQVQTRLQTFISGLQQRTSEIEVLAVSICTSLNWLQVLTQARPFSCYLIPKRTKHLAKQAPWPVCFIAECCVLGSCLNRITAVVSCRCLSCSCAGCWGRFNNWLLLDLLLHLKQHSFCLSACAACLPVPLELFMMPSVTNTVRCFKPWSGPSPGSTGAALHSLSAFSAASA